MNDQIKEQSADEQAEHVEQADGEPTAGRRPWTDAEKAQIRMLFRNLGIILVFVLFALALAVVLQSILY